ncbi:MAG TPA: peroxiredoxin [Rhodocyclaceae bacterium]|nr:peroxiredoxin [Rhodocyclaceae bacterium]
MRKLCTFLLQLFTFWLPVSHAHAEDVPQVGSVAPPFSLKDQNDKAQTLSAYRGKWVVLYFYPKDDTPGCTEEACHFRDDMMSLAQLGAQVLGISIDDSASHAKFATKYNLPFPLLADDRGVVAKSYGAYMDWGMFGIARRYTFLIDPEGRIAKTYLKVDTSKHSDQIVADLKALSAKQ